MGFKVNRGGSVESNGVQEGSNKFAIKKDGAIMVEEINEIGLPIRYIRDTINGSSANTSCHWCQIQALSGVENVALNKSVTCSNSTVTASDLAKVTNGNLTDFASTTPGKYYVQVDLGQKYNVGAVRVYHYYSDGRTYNDTKTEVSADGINWITIFDSGISGKYAETSSGKLNIVANLGTAKIGRDGNLYVSEYIEA